MRVILLLCLFLNTGFSNAQFDKKIIGPIKTRKGVEFKEGDTLLFGRGAQFDGTFRYINMGISASTSDDPLPANRAHTTAVIKLFREGIVGRSPKFYAALKAGTLYTAFADLEAAVESKEIIAINGQEIGQPRAVRQGVAENTLTTSSKTGLATGNPSTQGDMTVKPFSNDIGVKILSIEGNKTQQTVTVTFVLKTELPHQNINFLFDRCHYNRVQGKAYDGDGTEYNMKSVSLGNNIDGSSVENKLPTSVPLKGSITFANVLPKASILSFITFYMSSANYDGGEHCQGGNVEIRNAKIDWK